MKAIVYAAKSTQDKHASIPTQLDDCREMAAENGWQIVDEYSDEGFSAYSGNRGPQWAAAQEHAARVAAETDSICMLIGQHSDRFARGAGDAPGAPESLVEIWHRARRLNVHLRSVEDDFDLRDAASVAAIGQRAYMDSKRKSKSVSKGMKRRAKDGKHLGGPRRFGFTYAGDGMRAVESEQAIVRRIDAEFLAGKTLTAIARDLHAEGLRTAQGRVWRPTTVRAILANPLYAGRIRTKGEEFDADVDPCRSDQEHKRIQDMLGIPSAVRRGRLPNGNFLFRRGMLRCGQCGYAITSRSDRRWRLENYLCSGRMMQGAEFCDMPTIKRVHVDSAVFRYFEQVGLDIEATRQTVADARERKLVEVRALREEAEHEVRRAEERLARVRRDYTDGTLDAQDWREFREELGAEREAARAAAHRLTTQLREVETWGAVRDAEAETWRRLSEIRAVIAGEVRDAEGLDAVRAALNRTFEHFVLRRAAQRVHVELIADVGLVIEPVVRRQAIQGYSENLRPVLHRESLNDPADISRDGAPMFGPIELGVSGGA